MCRFLGEGVVRGVMGRWGDGVLPVWFVGGSWSVMVWGGVDVVLCRGILESRRTRHAAHGSRCECSSRPL